ncbi:hypothetical protein IMG5_000460 [Ichthyophthirius multifiliis]|uniref:Uncharacterized protein n=1 Tax=Ichthyophthirius multifiliis TaxID=5932 RepID=G0QIT3_ICHMU|nr:hypothetical protein IMG5_000460 [Ichthyophthirius multifiliis]EGR34819.1 hypothetical protein IMG5_000460 [Ichthyophthirius multifiliis]|eukprot:XP_004040123.1 hypothetical protein IMG5_000460 [Ichthyophthirius multifiliis]
MQEYDIEAKNIENELIQKQALEYQKAQEEFETVMPSIPKDSSEVLNLIKMEERLVKQSLFIDAHKIKQQRIQLQKEVNKNFNLQRTNKLINQMNIFKQKQNQEQNALKQRIFQAKDELQKARNIELENTYKCFNFQILTNIKMKKNLESMIRLKKKTSLIITN